VLVLMLVGGAAQAAEADLVTSAACLSLSNKVAEVFDGKGDLVGRSGGGNSGSQAGLPAGGISCTAACRRPHAGGVDCGRPGPIPIVVAGPLAKKAAFADCCKLAPEVRPSMALCVTETETSGTCAGGGGP